MIQALFDSAANGDRKALARAISRVEAGGPEVTALCGSLKPRRSQSPGSPVVVGITGPPGAGKSTLVNHLIRGARAKGKTVGVVAVDPSSPFLGGAILADRIRMEEHSLDLGVFVRSLSSRGHLGGLTRAAGQVVDLMDAAGFDVVLVETVGVGQSELAVCEVADTVVVVLTTESGDTVQTMKAGLLEIADVFVVNKADRSGAKKLSAELEEAVELDGFRAYPAPVLTTSAQNLEGLEALGEAIATHAEWCAGAGLEVWSKRRSLGRIRTFLDLVAEHSRSLAAAGFEEAPELLKGLQDGSINPYVAAERWVSR